MTGELTKNENTYKPRRNAACLKRNRRWNFTDKCNLNVRVVNPAIGALSCSIFTAARKVRSTPWGAKPILIQILVYMQYSHRSVGSIDKAIALSIEAATVAFRSVSSNEGCRRCRNYDCIRLDGSHIWTQFSTSRSQKCRQLQRTNF